MNEQETKEEAIADIEPTQESRSTNDTSQSDEKPIKPTKKSKFKKLLANKKLMIIVVLVLIFLSGGVYAYLAVANKNKSQSNNNPSQSSAEITKTEDTAASIPEVKKCDTKGTALTAKWYGTRTKLGNLNILKPPKAEEIDSTNPSKVDVTKYTEYYKIGVTDDNKPIILIVKFAGWVDENNLIAVETSSNHYSVISKSSSSLFDSINASSDTGLQPGSKIDSDSYFPDLCVQSLSYKLVKLKDTFAGLGSGSTAALLKPTNSVLLQKYDIGSLYEYKPNIGSYYYKSEFVLKRNDTLAQYLEPDSPLPYKNNNKNYDNIADITWSDGSKNTKTGYNSLFRGCGQSTGVEVLSNTTISDLKQIGEASNGTPVYTFASTTNIALKDYYKQFKDGYNKDSFNDRYSSKIASYTINQYLENKSIIVIKDQFGRYLSYVNLDIYPGGGCGKPVVYLYPTQKTDISVKVGANIVKSDPYYGNGWEVTANPNGNLISNGNTYSSLYWEGYGNGYYPNINSGIVVAQNEIKSTIQTQLKQQGLNQKETSEFMDFWLPRLPKTPYVRLTWFGTNDMNRLAPLSISPAPDTIIRTFLDAEGMGQYEAMTPQKFYARERKGFTVVEWGGLINGKIH